MCGLVYGLGDILAIRISLPPAPEAESLWATGGGEGLRPSPPHPPHPPTPASSWQCGERVLATKGRREGSRSGGSRLTAQRAPTRMDLGAVPGTIVWGEDGVGGGSGGGAGGTLHHRARSFQWF